MTDELQSIRPSTETNLLLGQLMAKVDALSPLAQAVAELKADVAVLKAQQAPRAPWWAVVGGISGILAVIATSTGLIVLFTK
jgi:hypothetical protein